MGGLALEEEEEGKEEKEWKKTSHFHSPHFRVASWQSSWLQVRSSCGALDISTPAAGSWRFSCRVSAQGSTRARVGVVRVLGVEHPE